MNLRRRVALTLLAALSVLAFPAAASAVTFAVNTTADEAKKAECEAEAAGCTLRGAIEAANASVASDAIFFTLTPFNGNSADTINLASPLPAITDDDLLIDGTAQGPNSGLCVTEALVEGPCAGVNGPTGNFGLVVEADGVVIEGLAITGALIGINVINESEEFIARGNWIGVDLKGEAKANNTGIFLDPGSDKAEIGGSVTTQRNVIAGNNNEGLDMQGASEATIRGNFFGVAPDGTTPMGNPVNIEITDSTSGLGAQAVNNEIGGQLNAEMATTSTCDAACNLISGATYGIDLSGSGGNEAPASGPTQIAGNHIGLAVTGVAAIANGQRGVLIGGADEVTVGGPAFGYGNHLVGGVIGILAGKAADDLDIEENAIGIDASGSPLSPPSEGINVSSEEIAAFGGEAEIVANAINGTGTAITQHSIGALIAGNEIVNPGIGIYTYGPVTPHGNAIVENEVVGASLQGILVENDENLIIGNEILDSGEAGIRIQRFFSLGVSGNQVGGDDPEEENEISFGDGPAIEIESFEDTNNEVARNVGSGNAGPFIDLISTEPGTEPDGPNEGIKPPKFSTATQSKAEGTAEPGATVRVFRKAKGEAGELQSFLGETEADGSGSWKLSYASIPGGTIVAATQTNVNGGTSELAVATAAADPSSGDGCKDALPAAMCALPQPPPPSPDITAPTAKITKAPKAKSSSTTAKFKFKANEAGSRFECKLDKGKFKKCKSPKTYKKLKPGKHVFKVRAIDKAGNVGKPAKRKFTVEAS